MTRRLGSRRAKFLLALCSVAASLLLCEIALHLVVTDPVYNVLGRLGGYGEEFFQAQWVQRAFSRTNPHVAHSPTRGWQGKAGYRSDFVNLNSRGSRGLREYPFEKPAGTRRIVVLGDSYTFGHPPNKPSPPVPDEGVWTVLLERGLARTEVINLAVDGYGTDQMLLTFRESGRLYQPDLVVLSLLTDDLRRATLAFRDSAKPRFRIIDGELVLTGVPIPTPEEVDGQLELPSFYLPYLLGLVYRNGLDVLAPIGSLEYDQLNEAILTTLRDEVEQSGARLAVVVFPDVVELDARPVRAERLLAGWASRSGVPLLSLRDDFDGLSPQERERFFSAHWTRYGHQRVAEMIRIDLEAEQLLP